MAKRKPKPKSKLDFLLTLRLPLDVLAIYEKLAHLSGRTVDDCIVIAMAWEILRHGASAPNPGPKP